MAAAYQCHFNQFSSKFHIRIASIKLSFNTFDSFTNSQGRSGLPCEFDADLW